MTQFDIKVPNNVAKINTMGTDIINMYKSPNAENSLAKNINLPIFDNAIKVYLPKF